MLKKVNSSFQENTRQNKTMRKVRDKEKEYQVVDTRKATTKNTVQSKNIKVKYSYFCKNVEKTNKQKKLRKI